MTPTTLQLGLSTLPNSMVQSKLLQNDDKLSCVATCWYLIKTIKSYFCFAPVGEELSHRSRGTWPRLALIFPKHRA